jgi:hypothetical protein
MRTKRVIGLIVLTCILASLGVLAALIAWLGAVVGITVGLLIAVGVIAAYIIVLGPWQRRWGASDGESERAMPGEDLLRSDAPSTTRAITIEASPEDVFPWLLQIGYGRGGWYSYDWIDNDRKPSVERIEPALQRLAVGERLEMLPGFGPVVREIVPNHHVLSGGEADTWCLLVEPTAGGATRLISRWRQDWPRNLATYVWTILADPGAFVMEQKMLRRIRDLAERNAAANLVAASDGSEARTAASMEAN